MADPSQVPSQQLHRPPLQRVLSMPASLASAAPIAATSTAATAVSPTTTSTSLGLNGYKVLGKLGEGTFGTVYKIQRKEDGEVLVWKELYYGKMNEKEKQQLVSEVNILRDLNHKHIVKYFDRIIDRESKKIYIVMEYCSGGDVASIIKEHQRNGTYVEEDFIWKILGEVCGALAQCHKCAAGVILHRDLKPANIFLDNPTSRCVKLGDFGLARTLKDSLDYARTHVGTPFYMSPEQVMELQYNDKSDIWSLGAAMYEIAALSPPFKATNHLALATKIRAGYFDRIPRQYSAELERVIRSMIQVDQSKRPSIAQIMRTVEEREKRLEREREREREADAVAAAHRRRTSLQSAPSGVVSGAGSAALSLNLHLAQRESELASQAASLQKRLDECARRESMLDARERRVREKESQLDKRETHLLALQSAHQKAAYRVPLSNIANFNTRT